MALNAWGWEMPIEPPPKKKVRRKEPPPVRRPVYVSENNDIKGWFQANKPQSLAECADLRKALRTKKQVGSYKVDTHIARTGRKLTRVIGPVSNVMIVSRAARGYFNKRLRNLEVFLEVQRDQFASSNRSNISTGFDWDSLRK